MPNQVLGFYELGLRISQARIVCRDARQVEAAFITGWVSRCAVAWESIKNTAEVPTSISNGVDAAMTEALRLASILPTCDPESVTDNIDRVAELVHSVELPMRVFVERFHAGEGSAREAFELGVLLATLEDPELAAWLSGEDQEFPDIARMEELLQRTSMTLDDVMGDPSEDVEGLPESAVPSMRSEAWRRLEAGLANRWPHGTASSTDEAGRQLEDGRRDHWHHSEPPPEGGKFKYKVDSPLLKKEIAAYLGVAESTLARHCQQGLLWVMKNAARGYTVWFASKEQRSDFVQKKMSDQEEAQ
jgi:hypothetical protein